MLNKNNLISICKKTCKDGKYFHLTSGVKSKIYYQCARILEYPWLCEEVCNSLYEQINHLKFDVVVSPAIGGLIFGYKIAEKRTKNGNPCKFVFTEKKEGQLVFSRDFQLLSGNRVLIVEDVITTGHSSFKTRELIQQQGCVVIGIACIINRSNMDFYSCVDVPMDHE